MRHVQPRPLSLPRNRLLTNTHSHTHGCTGPDISMQTCAHINTHACTPTRTVLPAQTPSRYLKLKRISRTPQCCWDLLPLSSFWTSHLNSDSSALNYKTSWSGPADNAEKGAAPASVFTNARRGCCYLQPIFQSKINHVPTDSRFGTRALKEMSAWRKEISELCKSQSSVRDIMQDESKVSSGDGDMNRLNMQMGGIKPFLSWFVGISCNLIDTYCLHLVWFGRKLCFYVEWVYPHMKLQQTFSITFHLDFTSEEIILLELWRWVVWKYILLTTPTDIKRIT